MRKFETFVYYFKIVAGIFLILIGSWVEINILMELENKSIGYLRTIEEYYDYWETPEGFRSINQNYQILVGLGMISGAILLTTRKRKIL